MEGGEGGGRVEWRGEREGVFGLRLPLTSPCRVGSRAVVGAQTCPPE